MKINTKLLSNLIWHASSLLALGIGAHPGLAYLQSKSAAPSTAEGDSLRNQRYCEIFVVSKHGLSATAAVYNTAGLNDCPEAEWKALDPDKLKLENKAYSIVMNGPRYFMMDSNALKSPGPVRNFDGLEARLVAQVEIAKANSRRQPYVESIVDRESLYVYSAGKKAYELVSPDGKTYVMQSYSLEVDPHLTEQSLSNLASRLALPKGWSYVVRDLTQDWNVRTSGSKARIVQDDLKNTYQCVN